MHINLAVYPLFIAGMILILTSRSRLNMKNTAGRLGERGTKLYGRYRKKALKFNVRKRNSTIENEIYQSATLLENIVILQKNSPKGAAYIIEMISGYSKDLRKAFDSMLYYLRMNQKDEAVAAFGRAAGTKSAMEYGDILIKMDSMNPSELRESISLLRRRLREERTTAEIKKNEIMSDLIYIPVLANVMLIFLNFVYCTYYSEQKELFQQILF